MSTKGLVYEMNRLMYTPKKSGGLHSAVVFNAVWD